ncbi:T9SS type B sorting domain-containing protein [Mesonia aestuariivivens]|uniref:T9SS type B sorting domain-containing protein n=1 Tax=Mesonia aestuariivivens TaxID=2796128 RepID=A0ABS6W4D7_9FLAO|nr:T9SS type B sorting domain-containing protein [Mesonia aestuariivivens]MBW2961993.1 T9SS type B sorting domain-containing protein [Mesonia aestuariivivens]
MAQQPNDCVNAIVICGNGNFSSNASGAGVQEVSGCSSEEHNSIWIRVDIVQSGTLGFDLIPNNTDISVDYDFWVYGSNEDCLNFSTPIRCSTTNPLAANLSSNYTGIGNANSEFFEGPGAVGDGYVEWIDVLAGEYYYIVVDRPVGNGGFQMNWTGTASEGTGAFPEPPAANLVQNIEKCSDTGIANFDLGSLRTTVNSDTANNVVEFYESLADATDNQNLLPDNYSSTQNVKTVYAKVTSNTTQCTNISEFNIIVNQIEDVAISISENSICAPKEVEIAFTGSENAFVEYQINSGNIQQIQLDASGNSIANVFINGTTTIKVTNTFVEDLNGNVTCSAGQNLTKTIKIEGIAVGDNLIDFYKCDGNKDGKVIYNLTKNDSIALLNLGVGYRVSYHLTENQAINASAPITSPENFENTISLPQEIWVRVEDQFFTDCYAISSFQIDAYSDEPPSFEIERSNLNLGEKHLITIKNISGIGTYEFSINNKDWKVVNLTQSTINFEVKGGGQFIITGRHTEGCGSSFKTTTFIDYPKFFTPNEDGINDTWNIKGFQQNNSNAKILIFDRFGKLLKSISPNANGWDGNYNGKAMPSNDYWFLIKYIELLPDGTTINKSFKSNFSLIK